jgi:hypothetical protein
MKKTIVAFVIMLIAATVVIITVLVVINGNNHFDLRFVKFTTTVESISLTENESVVKATLYIISKEDLTGEPPNSSIRTKNITTTFLIEDFNGVQVGDTLDLMCKMDFRYEPNAKSCVLAKKN